MNNRFIQQQTELQTLKDSYMLLTQRVERFRASFFNRLFNRF